MRPFSNSALAVFGALLVAAAAAPAADVSPSTIDSGGATSAGGTYEVTGSIGQPDAGEVSGGSFVLSGGFWSSTHPFVPVELQSFEIVGGASPGRAPANAGAGEHDRTPAVSKNRRAETRRSAVKKPAPTEAEEGSDDDSQPSHATN